MSSSQTINNEVADQELRIQKRRTFPSKECLIAESLPLIQTKTKKNVLVLFSLLQSLNVF